MQGTSPEYSSMVLKHARWGPLLALVEVLDLYGRANHALARQHCNFIFAGT